MHKNENNKTGNIKLVGIQKGACQKSETGGWKIGYLMTGKAENLIKSQLRRQEKLKYSNKARKTIKQNQNQEENSSRKITSFKRNSPTVEAQSEPLRDPRVVLKNEDKRKLGLRAKEEKRVEVKAKLIDQCNELNTSTLWW